MNRLFLIILVLPLIWTPPSQAAAEGQDRYTRVNPEGLGIDGYSPVSYFEHGRAELGSADFEHEYAGIKYRMASQAQLEQFQKNPSAYLPAHGGWCSLMLSGSGRMTPANPESFKVVDGKLLLFWDGLFKGQAVNGLKNWQSKTDLDPKKESKRLKAADKTWHKIKQGKKSVEVVIFDDGDKVRLNQQWLSQAKEKY